jgi:hypothetical protein
VTIVHDKCGREMSSAQARFFPIRANTEIVADTNGVPREIVPHKITQLYERVDIPETMLTELYCKHCRRWYPYKGFTLKFACSKCGKELSFDSPFFCQGSYPCEYFAAYAPICIDCAKEHCVPCTNHCKPYRYFYDAYRSLLRKVES